MIFFYYSNCGFNEPFNQKIGVWSDHIHRWLDNNSPNFLLISYEDLKDNPSKQLKRVLNFAGIIKPNPEDIKAAVLASSFEKLQSFELNDNDPKFEKSDTSINFFRKGQVGESKEWFNQQQINSFLNFMVSGLIKLGYLSEVQNYYKKPNLNYKKLNFNLINIKLSYKKLNLNLINIKLSYKKLNLNLINIKLNYKKLNLNLINIKLSYKKPNLNLINIKLNCKKQQIIL